MNYRDAQNKHNELNSEHQKRFNSENSESKLNNDSPSIIPSTESNKNIPISIAQGRYLHNNYSSHQSLIESYNLKGVINVEALSKSLSLLVQRHEILRARFIESDVGYRQIIQERNGVSLNVVNLTGETNLVNIIESEYRHVFDIEHDDLCKFTYVNLCEDLGVLIVNIHHLVADSRSLRLLLEEFFTVYKKLLVLNSVKVEKASMQFSEYSFWEHNKLNNGLKKTNIDYWRHQLGGLIYRNDVINLLPTMSGTVSGRDKRKHQLSPLALSKLENISAQVGATIDVVFVSILSLLIKRYTGKTEFVLGLNDSTREKQGFNSIVGNLTSLIPIRLDFSEKIKFLDFLAHADKVRQEGRIHKDIPFKEFLGDKQKNSKGYKKSIIQINLEVESYSEKEYSSANLEVIRRHDKFTNILNGVKFSINANPEDPFFILEFCENTFDLGTIENAVVHFLELVDQISNNPNKSIEAYSLTESFPESTKISNKNIDHEENLIDIFKHCVKRSPEKVAIICNESHISYQELDKRSDAFARFLIANYQLDGDYIGVFATRSVSLVVTLLAILKCGKAYVPISPDNPLERINTQLNSIGVKSAVVCNDALSFGAKLDLNECIEFKNIEEAEYHDISLPHMTCPNLVCCAMFTSGSTGQPKAVAVPHKAISSLLFKPSFFDVNDSNVFLQMAPHSFDAFNFEFWGALLNEKTCALYHHEKIGASEIKSFLISNSIDTAWLTSGLFNMIVDSDVTSLLNLNCLVVGGDVLSVEHINKFKRMCPDAVFINGYGPTENTTFSTTYSITDKQLGLSVPIGKAARNADIYIIDEDFQRVPTGVVGQIAVSGVGLSYGYINEGRLTAKNFIPNPFSDDGGRLYLTGDLGRLTSSGEFEFLGRIDGQVKIRGYRVELAEVNEALRSIDFIADSLVTVSKDGSGEKNLVSYIVLQSDIKQKIELFALRSEIRERLKGKLPTYMVPIAFEFIEEFPLKETGKIDNRRLPELSEAAFRVFTPPTSKLELSLAGVWKEVLDTTVVGIDENFFEIGGHSLLAIKVINACEPVLGIEVPLKEFYEVPTIKGLVVYLNKIRAEQKLSQDSLELEGSTL